MVIMNNVVSAYANANANKRYLNNKDVDFIQPIPTIDITIDGTIKSGKRRRLFTSNTKSTLIEQFLDSKTNENEVVIQNPIKIDAPLLNPGEEFGYYILKSRENKDCSVDMWMYYFNDFLKWKYTQNNTETTKKDICKKMSVFCKSKQFVQNRIDALRDQVKKSHNLSIPRDIAEYIFTFVSRKQEYTHVSNRIISIMDDSRYNCDSNFNEIKDDIIESCW